MRHKKRNEITPGQWFLISTMEMAYRDYYNDELTQFKGKNWQDAKNFLDEHYEEYMGICWELGKRQHRRAVNEYQD